MLLCKSFTLFNFVVMKHFIIICTLISLIGCTTTKYVEVPIEKTKIEYKDRLSIDTVIQHDSTIITMLGDTVYLEKYKYIYKVKELRDTINITDTTTVTKPIEVVKEINKLYTWQIVLMVLGGVSIITLTYLIVMYLIKTMIMRVVLGIVM